MSLNATAVSILTYACELLTRVVENTKITINIQPSEKPEVSQTEQVKQTNEQTNEQVKQSKQANNVEVKDPCENIQKTRGLIHTDLLQLIDVLERVCAIVKKINKSMIDDELWNDLWMD